MSTNDLDGGGGSGGGDFDGSDGSTTTIVIPASTIRRIAKNVVLGLVPGWILAWEAFQSLPSFKAWLREFVFRTITVWVVENVIEPIVGAFVGLGALIIEAILTTAFGADQEVGGSPGLADGVLFVATRLAGTTAPVTSEILEVVVSFNEAVAAVAASAGIAAAPAVAALVVGEFVVVFYVAWSIIQIIDFPFVDVDDFLKRVTEPLQALFRRLR